MAHLNWHTATVQDVVRVLDINLTNGLDSTETADRRSRYGSNELEEHGGTSPIRLLWTRYEL